MSTIQVTKVTMIVAMTIAEHLKPHPMTKSSSADVVGRPADGVERRRPAMLRAANAITTIGSARCSVPENHDAPA
jgi:hypothetical protein